MIYHLAVYNHGAPAAPPFVQLQSPTPFHAIMQGQKVHFPNAGPFAVLDVTHEFGRDAAGNDHCTMRVLV